MNRIIISGINGFIGGYLARYYNSLNYKVVGISRSPEISLKEFPFLTASFSLNEAEKIKDFLIGNDIIINLAGAGIGDKKWTADYKKQIIDSRIRTTKAIVSIINDSEKNIKLINASAVGYYGDRGSELINEKSVKGTGFLSDVCSLWEAEANQLNNKENLIIARFGIILGKDSKALEKMLMPFKLFAGGYIGSGNQYISWLHVEDLALLLMHISDRKCSGIFNFTAPNPLTYKNFAVTASKLLNRPALINTPAFAIKLLLGEASELVLSGQRVIPERALEEKYEFKYKTMEECLIDILKK